MSDLNPRTADTPGRDAAAQGFSSGSLASSPSDLHPAPLQLRHISMGYSFERGESVQENARRIVAEEVESATDVLHGGGTGKQRDKAIHEARKSLKKLRGLLRLLRPELPDDYRAENRALRDIGRELSELRDAGAIIETFDSLIEDQAEAWNHESVSPIRKGLQAKKRQMERDLNASQAMQRAGAALAEFGERAAQWHIRGHGFAAIAPGFGKTYRDGRKAMSKAEGSKEPVLYHEWRKRAKDHWYHVRLLSELWAGTKESRADCLHALESSLGDDHNLEVLCCELAENPDRYGGEAPVGLFVASARAKQKALRRRALELGGRLYQQKPKSFVRDFERMWHVWQKESEPAPVSV